MNAALTVDTSVSIYVLSDPRTAEIRYIGKAADVARRVQQHLEPAQLDRYRSHKNSWLKQLRAVGLMPDVVVLAVVPAGDADEAERWWIALARSLGVRLTNGTDGGDGGAVTDPAARARIRAAHLGVKRSEDTRQRMSDSARRRCADPAEVERLRAISNGKPPVKVGEANPRAVLTDDEVRAIRERVAAGDPLVVLAAEFRVTPASITQIASGQTRLSAGGPVRPQRPRTRLTDEDVAEIRRRVALGESQTSVAKRFSIDPSHVSKTVSGARRRVSAIQEG